MDESKQLEEFRAQRDLIRSHLAWLDHTIARLEARLNSGTPPTSEASKPILGDDPPPQSAQTDFAAAVPSDPDYDSLLPIKAYSTHSGQDLQRIKIGCLILCVLGSLLFLFLLFGLPYLIG